nr:hypothetical protein [uncultured Acinetobacter sp.]
MLLSEENAPDAVSTLEDYIIQCKRIADRFQQFAKDHPKAIRQILLEATSIDKETIDLINNLLHMGRLFVANYLNNGIQKGFLKLI